MRSKRTRPGTAPTQSALFDITATTLFTETTVLFTETTVLSV